MAEEVGCEMGGWERTSSFVGCARCAKILVSWFVGVGQMREGCGLLKIGSGRGKLRTTRKENRMFAAGGNVAGNSRMVGGCEWSRALMVWKFITQFCHVNEGLCWKGETALGMCPCTSEMAFKPFSCFTDLCILQPFCTIIRVLSSKTTSFHLKCAAIACSLHTWASNLLQHGAWCSFKNYAWQKWRRKKKNGKFGFRCVCSFEAQRLLQYEQLFHVYK